LPRRYSSDFQGQRVPDNSLYNALSYRTKVESAHFDESNSKDSAAFTRLTKLCARIALLYQESMTFNYSYSVLDDDVIHIALEFGLSTQQQVILEPLFVDPKGLPSNCFVTVAKALNKYGFRVMREWYALLQLPF